MFSMIFTFVSCFFRRLHHFCVVSNYASMLPFSEMNCLHLRISYPVRSKSKFVDSSSPSHKHQGCPYLQMLCFVKDLILDSVLGLSLFLFINRFVFPCLISSLDRQGLIWLVLSISVSRLEDILFSLIFLICVVVF